MLKDSGRSIGFQSPTKTLSLILLCQRITRTSYVRLKKGELDIVQIR